MVSYQDARQRVIEVACARFAARAETLGALAESEGREGVSTTERATAVNSETIEITANPGNALGRVLAEDIAADRAYPPFARSIRDGFAVRAGDLGGVGAGQGRGTAGGGAGAREEGARAGWLRIVGESKAGTGYAGSVGDGECVRIMTGAPVPAGADAVVMVEQAVVEGERVSFRRGARAGEYIVAAGREAREGQVVVRRGARLGYAELAMAAQVGRVKVRVARKPRVAILSTGDEVVMADEAPGPHQIRNSNSVSLAAQLALAGGEPVQLGNAPDTEAALRGYIERGLHEDILVISGGVSAGKYDLVENVLSDLGAEFFFDAIAIRPGRPAVFGVCRDKLVFGLPGNPVSTMVTFELLALPAIDILSGTEPRELPLFKAAIKHDLNEKPDLAHFLPARVEFPSGCAAVETLRWQGSGDVVAVTEANCFVVVDQGAGPVKAGELVKVMPRRGQF